MVGGGVIVEQGPQSGGQQPDAYADSGPKHAAHHNHVVLSKDRTSNMNNGSFSGLVLIKKTSMPCASPRSHFAICGPLCQAVLKPKVRVDVCGLTIAWDMLMSRANVTAKSQAHVPSWFCT